MRRLTRRERVAGIVAAVLVTAGALHWAGTLRARARRDALRQHLVRLAMVQESYRYDRQIYGADPAEFVAWGFQMPSDGRIEIVEATGTGWSAVATHPGSGTRCYLFVREAAPVGPATEDGVVACT